MRRKNLFVIPVVIVFIAVWFFLATGEKMEHIADTNGPDDRSLAVITVEDIVADGKKQCVGTPGTSKSQTSFLGITTSSGTTYSTKQFSGIYRLESWNLFGTSDLVFTLYNYEVTAGNLMMCVVHDGQIVATIEPTGDTIYFVMEDVESGLYELMLAGESAAFEFMSHDFDVEE